jgi:two-component system cell cycle sensor histidine kinase/response regulator CckA
MKDLSPPRKNDAAGWVRKPFSLRGKMLVYFGLIYALALFADGMYGLYGLPFTDYHGEYRYRRAEAFRDLGILADSKKAEILHLIAERRGDAATFCESPVFRKLVARVSSLARKEGGAGAAGTGMNSLLERNDDYRYLTEHLDIIRQTYQELYEKISLADVKTGTIIASTDGRDVGTDVSGNVSFQEAKEMVEIDNIDVLRDPRSGSPYLMITHSIRDLTAGEKGEEAVIGVLVLYLKPDVIIRALKTGGGELDRTGEIVLVNEDAQILHTLKYPLPDGTVPRPLEFRLEKKPALLAAAGNEGIIATVDYRGEPILAAFRHLRLNSETGWGMVVKKDQSEVFAPLRQLIFFFVLKAIFLGLLGLGLTYAIATRLARPIRQLSRTARKVEEGDFSVRAPVEEASEVGDLAKAFNSMVQRIQNWHAELEVKVKDRTAELLALNTELEGEIAERQRAEEALGASERRFRELLETVHLVAIILDKKGNITFCNDFLLILTGWTRDEVLGRNWFDMFLPDEARTTVKPMFMELLASSAIPKHYENPIVTRSGARRSIVWDNTVLRGADGSVVGTASLGIDVTEHRSLEEQLRHAQKMEAVGQLAGGVAHDFNNLLTVIIGNCELIKLKAGQANPLSSYVEQILLVSGKAARLTQSLLAFSRKQLLSIEAVDVNECIRGVEHLLARIVGEEIDFRLGLAVAKLPVMADRGQLEQVLVNLVANARDAMPSGGDLLIETRRSDLDTIAAELHGLENAGAYVVIQVSDTGSGMDETTRKKIFEPFFTTKEVGKGTGLGLAMVFGTIRQHGGYINVYSEVGRGTVFKLYLPLIQEETGRMDHMPQELAAPGGSETLLVVEDNEDVRKTTAAILENFGYRVIEAADGEEAIARFMASADSISLAILDVIMPKMSGKEVYDALRKVRPDLKVLFTSGYAADIINRRMMMEEGLHFLQKPASPMELLQKVRELLDSGSPTLPSQLGFWH